MLALTYEKVICWVMKDALGDLKPTLEAYTGDELLLRLPGELRGNPNKPETMKYIFESDWFRVITLKDFPALSVRIAETGRPLHGSPLEFPLRPNRTITFDDLSEQPDPAAVPLLDRPEIDETRLSDAQRFWRRNGYLVMEGCLPEDLVDAYRDAWKAQSPSVRGWATQSSYRKVPEMADLALYRPVTDMLEHLIGAPMGVNLTLTGWVSTSRAWHQDDYLNPSFVNSWYAAAWMALDDIHPDSGPFEFVAGSHRWPALRRDSLFEQVPSYIPIRADWPSCTENIVVPACEAEIAARDAEIETFLPKKGDVLLWHGRLMHRGSLPKNEEILRPALICHYTAIDHNPDAPTPVQAENGSWYFPFDHALD